MNHMKCKCCGKEISKDKAIQYKPYVYFCSEECLNNYKQKQIDKTTKKKNYIADKDTPRRNLTDYIQKYYINNGWSKTAINWNMIGSQISNLIKEYGFTYDGIRLTLYYMAEVKQENLLSDTGSILNLVPYEYQNAEQYWKQIKRIQKATAQFDFSDDIKEVKTETKEIHYGTLDF